MLAHIRSIRARLISLILLIMLPLLALMLYLRQQLPGDLLLLAISAAAVAVLAWIESEYLIVRPIRLLIAATNRFSAGDFSARSGLVGTTGELSLLARTFDTMAETLEQRSRELSRTEQHYQTLLEQLPAIIWTVDCELRLNAILGSQSSQLTLADAGLLGHTITELFPPEQPEPAAAHQRALAGETASYTFPVLDQIFAVHVEPLRDAGGQIVGAIGVASDITATQRAAAEAERRSRELGLLNAAIAAAGGSLNAPRLLATVAEQLAEHVSVAAGAILVLDPALPRMVWKHTWGLASALEGLTVASTDQPYNDLETLRQPILVDCSTIPQLAADKPGAANWQSCMLVPLQAGQRISAVLLLLDQRPHVFDQAQHQFYHVFGNQIGITLRNALLFEEVRAGRERLLALSRRLVAVQEDERRNIARELHDEIGQTLTGLKLVLETVPRLPADQIVPNINQARGLVNELMGRVRDLSLDLRPAMLDDLGLVPALLWHIERYTNQTQISVDFKHTGITHRLPSEIETAAYRITQEALTNVARYANTPMVCVRLNLEQKILNLAITDHGNGFDPQAALAAANSSGLTGMRERASLVGGQMRIQSEPGNGTCLIAELPLEGRIERRAKEQRDDNNSARR